MHHLVNETSSAIEITEFYYQVWFDYPVIVLSRMGDVSQARAFRPWLHGDYFFKKSTLYQKQEEALAILHGFTDSVKIW